MWESGGENIGNLLAAILRMIQQNQMKSEAQDQFGSAVSGATRTSYNPTPSNIQQGQEFGDVLQRGTIEAQPRDPGTPIIGSQLGAPIAASLGQVVAQRGQQGQGDVATNPYARTDSLDNNALMRSLAQMLGQTQNPALVGSIGRYFEGQKAVQGLQPEYGFQNTPTGLYRTNKQSGGANLVSGSQPPMIKPSFKTDNVTVDENGKPMQYRIITDELGNEVRREKIGPSYQKPGAEKSTLLRVVQEDGQDIEYYGFVDELGREVVTKRQPRTLPGASRQKELAGKLVSIETNLNEYEKLLKEVPGGRIGGTLSKGAALLEMNPSARAAAGLENTLAGVIARALNGEVGVLTDQDIARAKTFIPQITDNDEERNLKFRVIRDIIAERKEKMKRPETATEPIDESKYRGSLPDFGGNQTQETRTVGGKTYVKINGEWYEQ